MVLARRLLADAPRLLAHGGLLCLECDEAQAGPLLRATQQESWVDQAHLIEDLAGRPRGLWIQARGGRERAQA